MDSVSVSGDKVTFAYLQPVSRHQDHRSTATSGLELLCVPKFEVDLEFSGGPSEPGIVDVAVHVSVDGGQRGT